MVEKRLSCFEGIKILHIGEFVMGTQVVCRVCGLNDNNDNAIDLYGDEASLLGLPDMIKKYTPIQLDGSDNVAKFICNKCKVYITGWHQFWENCLKVEEIIKRSIVNKEKVTKDGCAKEDCETQSNQPIIEQDATTNAQSRVGSDSTYKSYYCIAKWCTSNNRTNTLFRIPKDERRHTWLIRAGREDLIDMAVDKLHAKYLCEKHFADNMFNNSNRNSLMWSALPTVFQTRKRFKCSALSENDANDGNSLHILKKRCKLKSTEQLSLSKKCNANEKERACYSLPTSGNSAQMLHIPFHNESSNVKQVLVVSTEQLSQCNFLKTLQSTKKLKKLSPMVPRSLLQKRFVNKHSEKFVQQSVSTNSIMGSVQVSHDNEDLKNSSQCDLLSAGKDEQCSDYEDVSCRLNNQSVVNNSYKLISKPKLSQNVVTIDTIEHLKESDVDSLCSGQGFRECMYPCLACGEVFLMKSSLDQHCKTYHDANFYSSSG